MHPSAQHLLKFFEYKHLPERLQPVSKAFCGLAYGLARDESLGGPELTAALRKLLEAKDCTVRAAL